MEQREQQQRMKKFPRKRWICTRVTFTVKSVVVPF